MMILITGGSGSGKSAYAEAYINMLSENSEKYYIATMQVRDKEGQAKIERHQRMRAGKGFLTIEQPVEIVKILGRPEVHKGVENTALLECMSNLVANEMFAGEEPEKCEIVAEKIIRELESLNNGLKHLVIVTNNVFEDGIPYDKTTLEYIRAMGGVNERLARMADKVIEVVAGIPVTVKEGGFVCG